MNENEFGKIVNEKGILALLAVWFLAYVIGSRSGLESATIAVCCAYLSDVSYFHRKDSLGRLAMGASFGFVVASIVFSLVQGQ